MQPVTRTFRRSLRRGAARGLTLVEMIVVITIIGVLTAAISIGVMSAKKKADLGAAKTACNTIRDATIQRMQDQGTDYSEAQTDKATSRSAGRR